MEVFELLESIYQAFDVIAHRRGICKASATQNAHLPRIPLYSLKFLPDVANRWKQSEIGE